MSGEFAFVGASYRKIFQPIYYVVLGAEGIDNVMHVYVVATFRLSMRVVHPKRRAFAAS